MKTDRPKLTDSEGQFIWRESMRDGLSLTPAGRPSPDVRICAKPRWLLQQLFGLLGNFSHYWIIDSLWSCRSKRLTRGSRRKTGQIGFIGRLRGRRQPVLPEAFRPPSSSLPKPAAETLLPQRDSCGSNQPFLTRSVRDAQSSSIHLLCHLSVAINRRSGRNRMADSIIIEYGRI